MNSIPTDLEGLFMHPDSDSSAATHHLIAKLHHWLTQS